MSVSGPLGAGNRSEADKVLRLLADPEAAQSRVREVASLEERANVAIATFGAAEQIPGLQAAAAADRKQAAKELSDARARAASIIDEAQRRAADMVQDATYHLSNAQVHEQTVTAGMRRLTEETRKNVEADRASLKARRLAVEASEKKLKDDQAALAEALAELKKDKEALSRDRLAVEEKLARMSQVWGG